MKLWTCMLLIHISSSYVHERACVYIKTWNISLSLSSSSSTLMHTFLFLYTHTHGAPACVHIYIRTFSATNTQILLVLKSRDCDDKTDWLTDWRTTADVKGNYDAYTCTCTSCISKVGPRRTHRCAPTTTSLSSHSATSSLKVPQCILRWAAEEEEDIILIIRVHTALLTRSKYFIWWTGDIIILCKNYIQYFIIFARKGFCGTKKFPAIFFFVTFSAFAFNYSICKFCTVNAFTHIKRRKKVPSSYKRPFFLHFSFLPSLLPTFLLSFRSTFEQWKSPPRSFAWTFRLIFIKEREITQMVIALLSFFARRRLRLSLCR